MGLLLLLASLHMHHRRLNKDLNTSTVALLHGCVDMSSQTRDPYRLPLHVRPRHYDISIQTDLQGLTFDGFVKIE
jgi:hypothetical protein